MAVLNYMDALRNTDEQTAFRARRAVEFLHDGFSK
jgi:hypothetical protein